MIQLKTKNEIELLRRANQIIAEVREELKEYIVPGASTYDLDKFAEERILHRHALPAFKGYMGFPATLCVSINDEVVHGIPKKNKILKDGDIIGIDMGTIFQGYFGDSAVTFPVGKISKEAQHLLDVTEKSLFAGISQAIPGNRIHDIGYAVQSFVEAEGFSVVREFVGHGIGKKLHEDPQIPNFGKKGTGPEIKVGMVFAIEPMINLGKAAVSILEDGWTVVTKDGKLSAHFEHSIVITENGAEILSQL